MAITVLEVCVERLGADADKPLNGADFEAADLAIMGGCERCHATLAAYNGYPSRSGYWRCQGCLGDHGFETVAEFEAWAQENATRAGGA